jgi:hypothetical protein
MNIYSVTVNKNYLHDHRDTLIMIMKVSKLLKKLTPDIKYIFEQVIYRFNEYEVIVDKKYEGKKQKKYINKLFTITLKQS